MNGSMMMFFLVFIMFYQSSMTFGFPSFQMMGPTFISNTLLIKKCNTDQIFIFCVYVKVGDSLYIEELVFGSMTFYTILILGAILSRPLRFSFFLFLFLRQKVDWPAPKHRRQFTTWQVFHQVERRFHSRDSNRQPLP